MRSRLPLMKSINDILLLERTDLSERIAARTILDIFENAAEQWPDEPALIWLPSGTSADAPSTWTFCELLKQIRQTTNLLTTLAEERDSRISFLLPNLPEAHLALWGGAIAGQVTPINPLLSPMQIAEIMKAAGSDLLITAAPDIDGGACWARANELRTLMPELRHVLTVGEETPAGAKSFRKLVSNQPHDRLTRYRLIAPDDVSVCFHTGGTTGAPKIAQQTHWNQVAMTWMIGFMTDCVPGDRFLTALPLFHANAANFSGLTAFANGAATIIAGQAGFRSAAMAKDFWNLVDRYKVTHFSAVPTILSSLLDIPLNGASTQSLRICVCGAAPLPVSLLKKFENVTGVRILEGYGMTEGTLATSMNPRDGDRRAGSVGIRLPYFGLRVAQLDSTGRLLRDCDVDEVGVILINGPAVTPGYRQPELNESIWAEPGWFNSGDLGRLDADQYLWLTGRAKDLIIRGGHNIDPAVIEEALQSHPSVELAAAIGKPDAYSGEIPVAFVTLRPDARASEIELLDHARAKVPERPAAPQFVRILDSMPVTAVGKIFKPALRELAAKEAVVEQLSGLHGVESVTTNVGKERDVQVLVRVSDHSARVDATERLSHLPVKVIVE